MVEWYVPCMAVMRGDSSYCEGTPIIDSDIHEIANEPVNRYNMAQILFNIMTIYAVSYTHLDVYKRQIIYQAAGDPCLGEKRLF